MLHLHGQWVTVYSTGETRPTARAVYVTVKHGDGHIFPRAVTKRHVLPESRRLAQTTMEMFPCACSLVFPEHLCSTVCVGAACMLCLPSGA